MTIELSFDLKGSRSYVQGPDIVDAVIDQVKLKITGPITEFKYSGHRMLHTQAILHVGESPLSEANSIISFKNGDKSVYCSVVSNGIAITTKTSYDEQLVIDKCSIAGNDIYLVYTGLEKYSFSELIVSMNKFFLNQVITSAGKWIVSKIEYHALDKIELNNLQPIKLSLLKNLNNRLTKSSIFIDNELVGYLYFSLI